ncbi:MAG: radical SAM protein [Bacteroidales bacterium]|nr:radical SAM protein [Bacteroidales bacterium]
MNPKHYTIPVFIPELACPFRCIYCDQHKITGQKDMPQPAEVSEIIEKHLVSFPKRHKVVEIGFFGGNFTGIDIHLQEEYLATACAYLKEGKINGIRLSTRPDYINPQVIKLLKKYRVGTVELGAQSMVEEVLLASHRGHTAEDTIKASGMIKDAHIRLGLQMMIGLPGDHAEYDLETARAFVELEASDARIYPTLVIKGTALEKMYLDEKYSPLSMEEAAERSSAVFRILEGGGVKVIKMGLHPSEGFLVGDDLVAGPFHEAFRELVMTKIWAAELKPLMNTTDHRHLEIEVSPKQFNFAIGHAAKNKKELLKYYNTVVFYRNEDLKNREYHAHTH